MRPWLAAGLGIVLAGMSAVLVGVWLGSDGAHQASQSGSPARTVLVADGGAALPGTPFFTQRDCLGNPTSCVNGAGGFVVAYAVAGRAPSVRIDATVLTDQNCEPDRFGVSHCLNKLRLSTGRTLTVRHDHNMGNDPCLSPGEHVTVEPLI